MDQFRAEALRLKIDLQPLALRFPGEIRHQVIDGFQPFAGDNPLILLHQRGLQIRLQPAADGIIQRKRQNGV